MVNLDGNTYLHKWSLPDTLSVRSGCAICRGERFMFINIVVIEHQPWFKKFNFKVALNLLVAPKPLQLLTIYQLLQSNFFCYIYLSLTNRAVSYGAKWHWLPLAVACLLKSTWLGFETLIFCTKIIYLCMYEY